MHEDLRLPEEPQPPLSPREASERLLRCFREATLLLYPFSVDPLPQFIDEDEGQRLQLSPEGVEAVGQILPALDRLYREGRFVEGRTAHGDETVTRFLYDARQHLELLLMGLSSISSRTSGLPTGEAALTLFNLAERAYSDALRIHGSASHSEPGTNGPTH